VIWGREEVVIGVIGSIGLALTSAVIIVIITTEDFEEGILLSVLIEPPRSLISAHMITPAPCACASPRYWITLSIDDLIRKWWERVRLMDWTTQSVYVSRLTVIIGPCPDDIVIVLARRKM
jgi:hypothetical protein